MSVRRNHFLFTTAILLLFSTTKAQSPSGQITDWKNNAQGAYSIIHDDYGDTGVDGIWKYADTICANRGVSFTFGAITSACEVKRDINGYSSPYSYATNVMIALHGHEIISHSHTHACAVGNAGWSPCDLAPGEAWGEKAGSNEFKEQLETAHNSIKSNTGHTPVYYIYPYDRFTALTNNHLKTLGYIGSRTGWNSPLAGSGGYHRNGYENSDETNFYPDANGFFRTSVQVFDDIDRAKNITDQVAELNGEVNNAINSNMWANRELHNVGTTGWGSVKVESYRQHIDYIKQKQEEGKLWVATVSEILTYQIQKLKYAPAVSYNSTDKIINVNWTTKNAQINVNVNQYLNPLTIKCPITLKLNLDGLAGEWTVKQNGIVITDVNRINDILYINVFPHKGNLTVVKTGNLGNLTPYVQNEIGNYTNLLPNFPPFEIDLFNAFEDFETSDVNLILSYKGNSNLTVTINNGKATISSPANWTGTETITFTAKDEGALTVDETVTITATNIFAGHTPYKNTPTVIPGRLEAENYDNGNQGVAYNEIVTTWEPKASENPYRNGSAVDIVSLSGTTYALHYTETNEWTDYTINVLESGYYNVSFRIAQLLDQWNSPIGQIRLYIDNEVWVPTTTMKYTNSWTNYENVNYPNEVYLTKGGHLLRLEFVTGSVNIDYVEIEKNLVTNSVDGLTSSNIHIYPNPSSTSIHVYGDFISAKIYNQYGTEVLSSTDSTIDISELNDGAYYVKINEGLKIIKFMKIK